MTINTGPINVRQSRFCFAPLVFLFILEWLWLPFLGISPAFAAIKAEEVTIPQQLGMIQNRMDGAAGQPFIFVIGEEHVSLKVQQAVADILRYLTGAYDVKLVCTEGYDKPLFISRQGISLVAQRSIARADFTARRISGVEYFARAYPEVAVIGVEDMAAYQSHGKQLDKSKNLTQEAQQWQEDFKKFLIQDLGNLQVTASDAQRFEGAIKKFVEDKDFSSFVNAIYDVAGRKSAVGKKLTTLDERRQALERSAQAATVDSPEMQTRDQGMISATLRTIQEKKVDKAVLVVGKLHLEGIEKLLGAQKISYISIVPVDVEKQIQGNLNEGDQKIYQEWRKGKKTGLENWLSRFKPLPASSRPDFRDRTALLGILATADLLSRQGLPENEVLSFIRQIPLPSGVSMDRVFDINGGYGIEFTKNGKKLYAYIAGEPDQVEPPNGPEPIEPLGHGGGRYYAVYGVGGSKKPPIPPRGGGRDGGGSNPFAKIYFVAIAEQRREQPERVTIQFPIEDDVVVRQVDNGPKMVLNVTPAEVENFRRRYESALLGPDKLFAAQQLADALLIDLNTQFPEGRKELVQISENNLIGDISLPFVQELAGNEDASRLQSIDQTRVYTIPWESAQRDLSRLGRQIDDQERADKKRARDTLQSATNGKPLKDLFSKPLDEVAKTSLPPAVDKVARAPRIK